MGKKLGLLLTSVLLMTGCGQFNGDAANSASSAVQDVVSAKFVKGNSVRLDRFSNKRTGFHVTGYGNAGGEFMPDFAAISSDMHVDGTLGTGFAVPAGFKAVHKIYGCTNYGGGAAFTFTSADPGCEGYGAGPILAWVGNKQNGTTPTALYRCLNSANGDRMDTVSPSVECNGNGYHVEGVLGYIR